MGTFNVFNAHEEAKNVPLLKDKDEKYINSLLYLAQLEQQNFLTLFSDSLPMLRIGNSTVREFLEQGGFVEIFNNRQRVVRKDNRRYYITNALVVITIIIALIALYL